jgi:hypothetical protein
MIFHRPKELTVGRWHFVAGSSPSYFFRSPGWREVDIGVFKLNEMPPEGAMLTKKYYTGFMFRFAIFIPFVLR